MEFDKIIHLDTLLFFYLQDLQRNPVQMTLVVESSIGKNVLQGLTNH